ncbi:MAG: hypothetical protein RJQ14_04660 [Marinoscillum sp.]
MREQQLNLFDWAVEDLLDVIRRDFVRYEYNHSKHTVELISADNDAMGVVRFPLHLSLADDLTILDTQTSVLYLSIESGSAAICLMEGTENVYHTTFSAYMTRKKQGFSQIKYLNKKGKSRAGSRVRLAKTVEFFENINQTMNELWEDFQISRLALHCSKTLLPYLMQSKVPFPVDKRDPVLYKIPLHIPQSNYTNLDAAIKKLKSPVLFYDEKYAEILLEILTP